MIIYRTKIKSIIFEFLPPVDQAKGVIVICDGLPGSPKQPELLHQLSKLGYFVIFPRYTGTWESDGKFLSPSPTKNILQVINFIKKNELTELYANKKFDCRNLPIHLLGSSFGGSVALALANNKKIDKIIAFSPIVDFNNHNQDGQEQDLLWLMSFIQKSFGRAYDFKPSDWRKMVKGKIFNPPKKINSSRTKNILVFYDQDDPSIDWHKISDYTRFNKLKTVVSQSLGHLSFSKLSANHWKIVNKWLS